MKMSVFAEWDKEKAKRKISVPELTVENEKFVDGDHWQGGAGWIGPAPQSTEDGYSETMTEIEKSFTSRNVIAEVVERHIGGILGREPTWGLTPIEPVEEGVPLAPEVQASVDEAMNMLKEWWDEKAIHEYLQSVASTVLWAQRSNFRLYIPSGLRDEQGRVSATELKEALYYIHPDHPHPKDAVVFTDEATKQKLAVLVYYTGEKNNENVEIVFVNGEDTVIKLFTKEEGDFTYTFNFGKRITTYQVERPLLITKQVQQGQRALNLAISMLPRNIVTGGFLERVLLNAQMPGEWQLDPDTGERKRFVPHELNVGAGTTNFFRGIDYEEQDPMTGKTRTVLSQPTVHWRSPIETRPAIDAKASHYEDILDETDQAHILKQQHANASGKSLEQARSDFLSSLRATKIRMDALGRWLIETTLAISEDLMGKPGFYTGRFRAYFACRIDPGPIGSDEKQQNVNAFEKQIISRRTAMQWNGIADVDAEIQLINAQEDRQLSLRQKQAEALKAYLDAGITLEGAAVLIGMSDEDLNLIRTATNDEQSSGHKGSPPPSGASGGEGS